MTSDIVRDVPHHGQVVGYERVGETKLGLQVGEEIQHLRLDRDVERRDRLAATISAGSASARAIAIRDAGHPRHVRIADVSARAAVRLSRASRRRSAARRAPGRCCNLERAPGSRRSSCGD